MISFIVRIAVKCTETPWGDDCTVNEMKQTDSSAEVAFRCGRIHLGRACSGVCILVFYKTVLTDPVQLYNRLHRCIEHSASLVRLSLFL